MPRYFFHRIDGTYEADIEGTELPDIESARREAVIYAGESLKDEPDMIWASRDLRVEVTDEYRNVVFTLVIVALAAPSA